jgi:hypothetical protein
MPSNIIYYTPSNGNGNPDSNDPGPFHDSDQITREFNSSVERIFGNLQDDELGYQVDSPSSRLQSPSAILSNGDPRTLFISANNLAFDGNYREAGQRYKLLSLMLAERYGSSDWETVIGEIMAALMKAADFPGCPQSIIARFNQELSRFLIRERQKYIHADPQVRSLQELRNTLTVLKMNTKWAGTFITQQRAVQMWEPILGPEHPKIKTMRDNIAIFRTDTKVVNLDSETTRIQGAEDLLEETFVPDDIPQLKPIGDFLHLSDGSPAELLEKFHALENSDVSSRRIQQEIALLRYGRSRSLLGGYYSFVKRFDDAETAFQESGRNMKYETCVEIRLHRILWYAEHKTRVGDWDGVGMLICQAHEVFMKIDGHSEFVVVHFPDRFKFLCKATSKQISIDEVVNESLDDSASEHHQSGCCPTPIHHDTTERPPSRPASSIPSPERLFPLAPRGFNSAIDVETWRQFVHFSPTMNGLLKTTA